LIVYLLIMLLWVIFNCTYFKHNKNLLWFSYIFQLKMHGRVNRRAHTWPSMEIPTSNKHRASRWKKQSGDSNWPRHTEHVQTSNQIMFLISIFVCLISHTYYCLLFLSPLIELGRCAC
jgi:hypothetical protein